MKRPIIDSWRLVFWIELTKVINEFYKYVVTWGKKSSTDKICTSLPRFHLYEYSGLTQLISINVFIYNGRKSISGEFIDLGSQVPLPHSTPLRLSIGILIYLGATVGSVNMTIIYIYILFFIIAFKYILSWPQTISI